MRDVVNLAESPATPSEPADRLWQSAFDDAPVGMALCSPTGVALRVNRALAELVGRHAASLVGNDFFSITHEADVAAARAACRGLQRDGGRVSRLETRFVHAYQHLVWVLVSTSVVRDDSGAPAHLVMHVEDISQRKALEAELLRRAEHDILTGLLNRGSFLDRLRRTLDRAAIDGTPTSLLFVDLDDFKDVNDTHGHAVGDRVLMEVARRLEHSLRPGDLLSRLGGDEFTVICPDTDGLGAETVARRVSDALSQPVDCGGSEVAVTATVGLATQAADGGTHTARLLAAADTDMYARKPRRDRSSAASEVAGTRPDG